MSKEYEVFTDTDLARIRVAVNINSADGFVLDSLTSSPLPGDYSLPTEYLAVMSRDRMPEVHSGGPIERTPREQAEALMEYLDYYGISPPWFLFPEKRGRTLDAWTAILAGGMLEWETPGADPNA